MKWIVGLQFLEHVVVHLVAAGAELLGIGELQRGVEAAPEDHAGDEAGEHQDAEAEHRARPAQHAARSRTNAAGASERRPRMPARRLPLIAALRAARAAQQRVDVDEVVLDRRAAPRAAARGIAVQKKRRGDTEAQELAVAIHEMRDR